MADKSIRHKLANYLFYKEHAHIVRNGYVVSFNEAKNIGLLYDATSDKNYELVKDLVKEFRSLHKDVLALGYYNGAELPQSRFIKLGLDYFTKKSLNWKLKPSNKTVSNFINNEFDILICLSKERNIPLNHIASNERRFR